MGDLLIRRGLVIPEDELELRFARAGGPGGQNVNKRSTQVEVRWRPATSRALRGDDRAWLLARLGGRLTADGELVVTSTLTRQQARNREDALAKLAGIVAAALVRPRRRRATRPGRGAVERRLGAKKRRSQVKADRRRRGDD